jgi:hypothetical protein
VFGAAFNRTTHFSDVWIESGADPLWLDGLLLKAVSEPGYGCVPLKVLGCQLTEFHVLAHKMSAIVPEKCFFKKGRMSRAFITPLQPSKMSSMLLLFKNASHDGPS